MKMLSGLKRVLAVWIVTLCLALNCPVTYAGNADNISDTGQSTDTEVNSSEVNLNINLSLSNV